ncbi:MAG: protein adenylyltransferase SelO [Panacagrimonas sp.]
MSSLDQLPREPGFPALGSDYGSFVRPEPLPEPRLLHFNQALAEDIGLDNSVATDDAFIAVMSGNSELQAGASFSSVYVGHQFGAFVPQLGDGRAHLIGTIKTPAGGVAELQLKGAGRTPYSRFADGRAVLRSSIREYLCSEALHALGIPTTRALCLLGSPLPVQRETVETAAVVCRVAPSFLRFGNFEFFFYQQRYDALQPLADHLINVHFPELESAEDRYKQWLIVLVERTAKLMAQWQAVGFCHGVMNTDNFSALGLTIDYGPFGFIDGFKSDHICNHSDEAGRYAYDQQPRVGFWNCSRMLQAAMPLLGENPDQALEVAQDVLGHYAPVYTGEVLKNWRAKLGLREKREEDRDLANAFLNILDRGRNDFTRCFRALSKVSSAGQQAGPLRDQVTDLPAFDQWLKDYRARLQGEASDDAARAARMDAVNPKFVLRNHLLQAAIEKAETGDAGEIGTLFDIMQRPFDEQAEHAAYADLPPDWAQQISVSCSS